MTDLEANPIPVWTFDVEHEKKHAQWAWDTNQESLAWCLDGLIGEIERLRELHDRHCAFKDCTDRTTPYTSIV